MWDIVRPVMRYISPTRVQIILKCVNDLKTVEHTPKLWNGINRYFHNSHVFMTINDDEKDKKLAIFDAARRQKKEKSTFLDVIYTYVHEDQRKTGHVSFIYTALRYMDEFGVNEDLDVYKQILDTMPKGRYIATTLFQAEMMHYPREQQCIIDLLQKMEDNAVIPDPEMEDMIINICGKYSFPLRKLRRMAYWQTKFKNLNPWPNPRPLPSDSLELAKLAIRKIATVDVQSTVTVYNTKDIPESIDKTWIVSASSPDQEKLIARHPKDVAAYVEGPYRIWISKASVDYFILRTDVLKPYYKDDQDNDDVSNLDISLWNQAKKKIATYRSIHEQDEQIILGICATGTSSKDSLLSWIRCLQTRNPALLTIPILFKFIGPVDDQQKIGPGEVQIDDPNELSEVETQDKITS
ncbi:hypothetical protein PV327_002739 [Microctonus hyperodae]|uniref:Evolutionarily conserved signaling intermediate in Toll pathway, mitochondrial n=1 Tax=Microctonus hyperodae TaxID=165561 RepID=A0AA39KPE4_MICHY|nr:hypothetical protein PV327_002739 [Microctonus hyperodae]